MSDSGPYADSVQVAIADDKAIVRIRGRGSFQVSSAVKDFGSRAVQSGARTFLFDLTDCIGMDSTFMGTVAGLAFRLRKCAPAGRVLMLNLIPKTRNLLKTLGLDQVVETHMIDETPSELKPFTRQPDHALDEVETQSDRQTNAETALKAHEDLVRLSADNLPKFKDVIEFLREDVKQESAPS